MSSADRNTANPQRNADNPGTIVQSESDNVFPGTTLQSLTLEERIVAVMLYYNKELCFFAAILFTTFAALHTSPQNVSKPPLAQPFFNQSSVVIDFYKGHLGPTIEKVENADYSFIMYYAPWDAESQAIREEFEEVARYFHKQVFFAAINCWQPGSECRAQYSKIHSYPVFILYPRQGSGVQYRGIRTASYMIRFLHASMNPIFRITSKIQLTELVIEHDAVVMGYFNFTGLPKSPGYNTFYKAAIRSLERDPNREVAFAVVTDVLSSEQDYGITEFPSARLFLWNESLTYPLENAWTSDSLLKWVAGALHQTVVWLQPPGTKTLTLASYLRDGPVLFLFTPRNPFHRRNHNYNLIKEIGLQYYSCGDNLFVDDTVKRLSYIRHREHLEHVEKGKQCIKIIDDSKSSSSTSITNVINLQWTNESCCLQILTNKCSPCQYRGTFVSDSQDYPVCFLPSDDSNQFCKQTDIFNVPANNDDRHRFCCQLSSISNEQQQSNNNRSSSLDDDMESRSADALTKSVLQSECRRWLAGNNYHTSIFPKYVQNEKVELTPEICKSNKTLTLIAIDSLQFSRFAKRLGVNILDEKSKTAIIIVDPSQESQYILRQTLNYNTLVQFINNYTHDLLERNLQSQKHLDPITEDKKIEQSCNSKQQSVIHIPELNTDTFLATILDPDKDVTVMYHSPYCAFCHAVSYVYLTVAQYLRDMHNIRFFRINGDCNDLPWEYTMNRYPAILFFPAKRKEDSTVFPFSLPITIPNLLNFILANLNEDSYVEALVNICHLGIEESPAECVARIRWFSLDIIENLLRTYRQLRRNLAKLSKKTASKKFKVLLLRLQHIREIHLTLGSINDLQSDVNKTQFIRDKFRIYYRELSVLDVHKPLDNNVDRKHENIFHISKHRQQS